MDDDGVNKSAILLMSLGEEEAAEVLKCLAPREVQKLGAAMASLKNVSREDIEDVLSTFHSIAEEQSPLGADADKYLRSVLTRALGDEKAGYLLDRILQGGGAKSIESLQWMDATTVAGLIAKEHPQIIASILVHLERDQAADILGCFSEDLRSDVVLRIATLDDIQPAALSDLNEALSKILTSAAPGRNAGVHGGARVVAEILNFLGNAHETTAMEKVRGHDEALAQKIIDEMFAFDNLIELDDRGVQLVLREVQSESLILALKGANEELRDKIFSNMSQRAADMLMDDLESKGPVKVSEVEAEQKEILKIVRRLVEEGQVSMGSKGGDAYV